MVSLFPKTVSMWENSAKSYIRAFQDIISFFCSASTNIITGSNKVI